MKRCKNHPDVEAVKSAKCRSCYNEYMRVYCLERYHRIRSEAVASMGGKCVDCGSEEDLEFDHIDRTTKVVNIAKMLGYSQLRRTEELKKCALRCKTCHDLKTKLFNDARNKAHGEGIIGRPGCSCDKCKPLQDAYEAAFQEREAEKRELDRLQRPTTCECGQKKDSKSQLCMSCFNIKMRPRKGYPELVDLIDMVARDGYSATGRKIGVSDNSIRKHLKKHGISPDMLQERKDAFVAQR